MPDEKTGEYLGTGRRKSATARVRIKPGNGKITVNHRAIEAYFPVEEHRMVANEPFVVTENSEKFDVRGNVSGGGQAGQASAGRYSPNSTNPCSSQASRPSCTAISSGSSRRRLASTHPAPPMNAV